MLSKISVLEDEEQDQHDLDIEIEPQENPDPTPIPNQRPKWAQNLIEATLNVVGDPDDRRRTRSQYQNEHVSLSQRSLLSPE